MKLKFKIAVKSDVGLQRKNNEDNYYIPGIEVKPMNDAYSDGYTELTAEKAFMCVCDGMGGHSCGEVASFMAAKEIEKNYMHITNSDIKNKKAIDKISADFVNNANIKIYEKAESDPALSTMGTTMTGLYFLGGKAYFVNIGDSRSYCLNHRKISQLSIDHSDPTTRNAITRFLGMSPEYGPAEPDVAFSPAKIGSGVRFLLCSDGLSDLLDDDSIATIMLAHKDPKSAADDLVETAKKNGGHDNITVAVIDVAPESTAVKVIKNKAVCGCIAAALVAGLGVGGYTLLKPDEPVIDVFEDIEAELQAVDNAKNFKEALDNITVIKDSYSGAITEFESYSGTIDESDANVKAKNDELKTAIETAKTKLTAFSDAISAIETNETMDDVQKMEKVKELASEENAVHKELKDAITDCSTKKSTLDSAIDSSKKTPEPVVEDNSSPEKTAKPSNKPNPTKKPTPTKKPEPAPTSKPVDKTTPPAPQKTEPVKTVAPPAPQRTEPVKTVAPPVTPKSTPATEK